MKYIACVCLVILLLASAASAERITLVSGNAPIGERDPLVQVWGETVSIGGDVYSAANVELQQALVIQQNHNWTALPGSNWIGITEGESDAPYGGYRYQTHFFLPSTDQASISLTMSSDNWGSAYLNGNFLGQAVEANPESFKNLYTFTSSNQAFFNQGDNVLDFYVGNKFIAAGVLNPTGLVFNAQVDYVPEPASMAILAIGLAGVGFSLRRRSNHNQ